MYFRGRFGVHIMLAAQSRVGFGFQVALAGLVSPLQSTQSCSWHRAVCILGYTLLELLCGNYNWQAISESPGQGAMKTGEAAQSKQDVGLLQTLIVASGERCANPLHFLREFAERLLVLVAEVIVSIDGHPLLDASC